MSVHNPQFRQVHPDGPDMRRAMLVRDWLNAEGLQDKYEVAQTSQMS